MRHAILFACLAATVCAVPITGRRAALATDQPLEVTNITITDITKGNTTVSFNLYNPDPITKARALCTGTWKHNTTGYPQGSYSLCGNTTFAWNIYQYRTIQDFTFGLEHQFMDPSVGDPPYDRVTIFGRADVNTTALQCHTTKDRVTCNQSKQEIIYAPIYATSAK